MNPGPSQPDAGVQVQQPRRQCPRPRWRRRLYALAGVLLALCLVYGLRGTILPAMARWLDVSEPLRPADYVLILGGDNNVRPFAAAKLYRAGLVKRILVPASGLSPDAQAGLVPPDDVIATRVLDYCGVPPEAVIRLPGPAVTNTFDEAQSLARFLGDHPGASVTVLTTVEHTRRARWVFRKVLGRGCDLRIAGVPDNGYSPGNWWHFQRGLVSYCDEYCKLAYYWLRY